MAQYKYDELGYAETIYRGGFQTKHLQTEMKLLALYARDVLGMNAGERRAFLYEFCGRHIPGFARAIYFRQINRALNYASDRRSVLSHIESVGITQGEVDYIMGLNVSHEYRKIFFAFLVQMRLNAMMYELKNKKPHDSTYFRGDKSKYNAVQKMAMVPAQIDINGGFVHDMYKAGLIDVYYRGLIRHSWLDDCVPMGDVVIAVKDFEAAGWYFDYYVGVAGMKLCKQCAQPFRASRKDRTYCAKHKEYEPRLDEKTIACADCGAVFTVRPKANRTRRCANCQNKRRKEADRIRKSAQFSAHQTK